MTYAAECWPIKKQPTDKIHVTEMGMLRWSAGVTMLDKVPKSYIRSSFKIRPKPEKLTPRRLRRMVMSWEDLMYT